MQENFVRRRNWDIECILGKLRWDRERFDTETNVIQGLKSEFR